MPLETITIASVETAQTKSGPNAGSSYRVVNTTDGRKLFVFDAKLFPLVDHAHTIGGEIQPSKDGKSLRLVNCAEQVGSNGHATTGTPNDVRDVNIRRQVALKAAVDALEKINPGAMLDHPDAITAYLKIATTLADAFVAWLDPATDEGADPW